MSLRVGGGVVEVHGFAASAGAEGVELVQFFELVGQVGTGWQLVTGIRRTPQSSVGLRVGKRLQVLAVRPCVHAASQFELVTG